MSRFSALGVGVATSVAIASLSFAAPAHAGTPTKADSMSNTAKVHRASVTKPAKVHTATVKRIPGKDYLLR